MGTYTSNRNLYKPAVGETGWGALVDANFDTIDRVTVYDIRDFGVTPMERYVDGSMTASSTTFTSATANFVSGDAGKHIKIYGAGATNTTPLHTTISSVTNATTVVLSAACQRTRTSVVFSLA